MCKSISFVLFFVFGVSCAQAQIPEKPDPQLLVHAKTQLKQAEENLDAALAKIEYTDPGDLGQDRAHLVSQIAWEKTCRREQFREQLRDALAVDSEKRNEHQAAVVRAYYLCNIHLESKKPLWLLYQRVGWLRLFVAASEDSSYRQVHANANQREYLRRRILEPYELYTSDPKSVRKQAVAFLAQVVEDYVTRNHPQKKTLEAGEACLASGSKDPVVGLMVMQLVYEHKGGQAERYWKELPPILKELEKPEYPRFLNVLAQRTRFFLLVKRKKNKVSQETLKRGAGWIAKSMIAMLKEEAPVPEHVDSMQLLIKKCAECYSTLKHPMLTQQKQIAKRIEESDVVDWAKSFYLESAYISIGTDKSDDEKPDVDYLKAAEEWGAKATEELPLAMLPPSNLMWIAYLRGDLLVLSSWPWKKGSRSPTRVCD